MIDPSNVHYIKNPLSFIFNYISYANSVNVVLLDADKLATSEASSTESDEYYNVFWFRTKFITEMQFKSAEEDLASLFYTAWMNAGKPLLTNIN
jgi:hypothetical protein